MQIRREKVLKKVITISIDKITKQFIVPDIATDLELDVWFSVVKEEWKKQQKKNSPL